MNRKFLRDGLSHNFIAWILQLDRKTNSLQGTVPGKDFLKSCIRERNTNHLPFKVHPNDLQLKKNVKWHKPLFSKPKIS